MSSRALRRLQKEQEEERARQAAQEAVAEASDDDEVRQIQSTKPSAFALLGEDEGEDDDDDLDEDIRQHDGNCRACHISCVLNW